MAGYVSWMFGFLAAGCYLLPPPSAVQGHYHDAQSYYQSWHRHRPPLPRRPADLMADVVNDLGIRILQQYVENGNVAFSPAGVGFILAALYEGSSGHSRQQIIDCLGLPRDRNIVRIGMRDIHRRLRTYLNPDGFLGGLNLNRENTTLRPDYESILRFYGFDLTIDLSNFTANASSNNFGLKSSMTTTQSPTSPVMQSTTTAPPGTTTMVTAGMMMADGTMAPSTVPPATVTGDMAAATMAVNGATVSAAATAGTTTTSAPTDTTTIDTSVVILSTTPAATTAATLAAQSATTTTGAPMTTIPPMPAGIQAAATTMTTTTAAPTTTTAATTTTQQPTTTAATMMTTMPNTNAALISTTLPRNPGTTQVNRAFLSASETTTEMPTTTTMGTTSTTIETTTLLSGAETTTLLSGAETTTSADDIATVAAPTIIPALVRRRRGRRRRRSSEYFSNYPDDGLWMQDLDIWADQAALPTNVRDATELQFLVNGCEIATVPAATYTAVLPFAYFPSLKALALEFPLDNPRYNVLLFLPTDRVDTSRLARELSGQSIRVLRKHLQPTWVRATIPSFMLRGFVTLTPYLQRLGIRDVFEPRLADLTPMTPDLGVYARDVQQSIAVNIRNYMKADGTSGNGMNVGNGGTQAANPLRTEPPLLVPPRRDAYRFLRPVNGLVDRIGLVSFTAEHPFLYFIVDSETSVALIAGRIDDPLNSRIL